MYGLSEAKSFCSVNAHVDCDSVNTSTFSEILGIPVALIASFAFFVELLLLFGIQAFGTEEKQKLSRFFFYLCTGNMIATIVMGVISSFVLKTYCLMCMTIWFVSIILFFFSRSIAQKSDFKLLASDFKSLFVGGEQGARGVLFILFLVPVGAGLVNGMWKQNISSDLDKFVENSLSDWKNAQKIDFFIDKAPQLGNPQAPMQIVEFSDFQCPHCKRAAPSLHAFVNSHRDNVHFIFQNYPLDSSCNKEMKSEGHDQACRFARAALCSDRQGHFFEGHDWIFAHQDTLSEAMLPNLVSELNLDKAQFEACMVSSETSNELTAQLNRGKLAGIEGTPSIFVNGKLLPGGFIIPVLDAVLKSLKN